MSARHFRFALSAPLAAGALAIAASSLAAQGGGARGAGGFVGRGGGAVAHVDINNDGKTDVVVRQDTSGMKDKTFQSLFIFEEGQYPDEARKRRDLELKAVGSIDFYMTRYDFLGLKPTVLEAPPSMKGKTSYEGLYLVYIHLFRFENITYLLITRSPDLAPELGPEPYWTLVAKYKKGKVHKADPALMEDVCYLK